MPAQSDPARVSGRLPEETIEWRGPRMQDGGWRGAMWILLGLFVVYFVVSLIFYSLGEVHVLNLVSASGLLLLAITNVIGHRTRVRADPVGLRVVWVFALQSRRVRWLDIERFETTARWNIRRDLLVAVKRGGGRVFIGLPAGHEGLQEWWERYGAGEGCNLIA